MRAGVQKKNNGGDGGKKSTVAETERRRVERGERRLKNKFLRVDEREEGPSPFPKII